MLKVTTRSGAIYLVDTENHRALRLEGPEVHTRTWEDNEWANRELRYPVEVGLPMVLVSGEGLSLRRRITTEVEKIEHIEWKEEVNE